MKNNNNARNVKRIRVVGEIRIVDGGAVKELKIYLDDSTKEKAERIIKLLQSKNFDCKISRDENGEVCIFADKFFKTIA